MKLSMTGWGLVLAATLGGWGQAGERDPAPWLYTAADVQRQSSVDHVRLLDARELAAYQAGHVPGAVHLDLALWTRQSKDVAGLQNREFWAQAVGDLGIDEQTRVVVYGADAASAARAWWLLKFVGVPQVSLLDGGWKAWQEAGFAAQAAAAQVAPRTFRPDFQRQRLMDFEGLLHARENPRWKIWDSRSRGEYTGELVRGARPGHVPGAVHLEWVELLEPSGRFKTPEELRTLLAGRGFRPDTPLITYCYSGGRASVAVFAAELLGWQQVKSYYCGWQEWSARETAPAQVDEIKSQKTGS